MAGPLIPIGIALLRTVGPHAARWAGKKAATRVGTSAATRSAGSTAAQTAGSSTARNVGSRVIRDAVENGVNAGTDWGIEWMQQRGAQPQQPDQSGPEQGAPEQGMSGQHAAQGSQRGLGIPGQGPELGATTSTGGHSAFSALGAISALNEAGQRAAGVGSSALSPVQATHKALVG